MTAPVELDPIAFSDRYVPTAVRDGLDYVLALVLRGRLQRHPTERGDMDGVLRAGSTRSTPTPCSASARSVWTIRSRAPRSPCAPLAHDGYYYGLAIDLPYYVGGYFWWYYDEDCLPYASKPLWATLQAGFASEAAALSP